MFESIKYINLKIENKKEGNINLVIKTFYINVNIRNLICIEWRVNEKDKSIL